MVDHLNIAKAQGRGHGVQISSDDITLLVVRIKEVASHITTAAARNDLAAREGAHRLPDSLRKLGSVCYGLAASHYVITGLVSQVKSHAHSSASYKPLLFHVVEQFLDAMPAALVAMCQQVVDDKKDKFRPCRQLRLDDG